MSVGATASSSPAPPAPLAKLAALPGISTASGVAAAARQAQATGQVLPVLPELAGLLPAGGLRRGGTVAVHGSTSLLLALLAEATSRGSWAAVVGVPELGVVAAHELGVAVDRLALVNRPGMEFGAVTAALLDGMDLVAVGGAGGGARGAGPSRSQQQLARRLSARARNRGAVLLSLGPWPGAEVELSGEVVAWHGLHASGKGFLRGRELNVRTNGRGAAARPGQTSLLLPTAAHTTPLGLTDNAPNAERAGKLRLAGKTDPAENAESAGNAGPAEKAGFAKKAGIAGNTGPAEKAGPAGNSGAAGNSGSAGAAAKLGLAEAATAAETAEAAGTTRKPVAAENAGSSRKVAPAATLGLAGSAAEVEAAGSAGKSVVAEAAGATGSAGSSRKVAPAATLGLAGSAAEVEAAGSAGKSVVAEAAGATGSAGSSRKASAQAQVTGRTGKPVTAEIPWFAENVPSVEEIEGTAGRSPKTSLALTESGVG
ncbi:hypothetical protein JOM49_002104 [Amycolatopsis magusensis]|uniref:Protein RecA n=1 Tax=Amycolatopsis magusensis TaxID=882444 RepID=A0ABS4PP27_9PSEU|nr:hypothetical protein [Amycolatopsis magusensis]